MTEPAPLAGRIAIVSGASGRLGPEMVRSLAADSTLR